MGLLDGIIQKQNAITGEGEIIGLGLNSKVYYEGVDGVQNNGVDSYGNYQFTSLEAIINQFIIAYVGEDKIISKIKRTDVSFHAMRALQELSFDTFKSTKSYELEVPSTLTLPLPQDYVHYTKLSWVDSSGITRILYPASKTSNPTAFQQNTDGTLKFEDNIWENPQTLLYEEYGITRSRDVFGEVITNQIPDSKFKSKTPLPQFKTEIRVDVTGASRTLPVTGTASTNYVSYSTGAGVQINFQDTYSNITVGMAVFGPGIPLNSTVATVGDSTDGDYAGTGITITNPEHQANQLLDAPSSTVGVPVTTQQSNTQLIIVDMSKESDAWNRYRAHTSTTTTDDYEDDVYWPYQRNRYGLDPQHSQINGSYYIDDNTGLIHFGSSVSGKTVILDYLSDSVGTEAEMKVHKFTEEAMYKCIAHAILSTRANTPEYIVRRFQKNKFAAVRTAKLRLSNFKLEELTQILRGKSKQIKH